MRPTWSSPKAQGDTNCCLKDTTTQSGSLRYWNEAKGAKNKFVPAQATNKAPFNRVGAARENNGNRCGRRLRSQASGGTAGCNENADLGADKFGSKRRQPLVVTFRPAILDQHISSLEQNRSH